MDNTVFVSFAVSMYKLIIYTPKMFKIILMRKLALKEMRP